MSSEHNDAKEEEMVGPIDRALTFAENVLYTVSALLLLAGAVAVLGEIGYNLVHELDEGVATAVTHSLDGLLLVFILLELLAAVRATMVEHRLVAEPFLVAGIIASIKEIIVLSLEAADLVGKEGDGLPPRHDRHRRARRHRPAPVGGHVPRPAQGAGAGGGGEGLHRREVGGPESEELDRRPAEGLAPRRLSRRRRGPGGGGGQVDGALQLLLGVGQAGEEGLERARGQGDAPVEQVVEEAGVAGAVGLFGGGVVVGGLVGEEEAHEGADGGDLHGEAGLGDHGGEVGRQLGRPARQLHVGGVVEEVEDGQAGGGGQGVPRQRARLVDGPAGGEHRHHVGPAPEGGEGQSPADDLAEGGEVGGDAEVGLGAAGAEAEAGDDLVEDEEGAGPVARLAESVEEARRRGDEAHVGRHRLDHHRGHVVADLGDDVVGDDEGVGDRRLGHAGRAGQAEGGQAAAAGGQEVVGVAVVAAVEDHDAVAAGEAAGHPDGRHARLGAAGDEPDALARRHPVADGLGQEDLPLGGGAVRRALGGGPGDGLDDLGVGVAEDRRPPRLDVVGVLAALDVPHVGALGPGHEVGGAADLAEGPDGRVDAAGDDVAGPLEQALVAGQIWAGQRAWASSDAK